MQSRCACRGRCAEKNANKVEQPNPYANSPSRFGAVELHAGFRPDPHSVEGTTKAEVLASTIHKKCEGYISEKPDYLLQATTAFFKLHVMARSADDVTVVVRTPDGKVLCNNDRHGGKDAMIHSTFPIGVTQVFVGTATKGAPIAYTLGFSEVSWKPGNLPLP